MLIATQRIEGDRFAAKKARTWIRRCGRWAAVPWYQMARPGASYGAHQDRYFAEHGLDVKVDTAAAQPCVHLGPVRMRKADSRAERETAQRAVGAIGPSLERIGEVEANTGRTYRTGVETQQAADATGIPRFSPRATAAIGTIPVAPDELARGEA